MTARRRVICAFALSLLLATVTGCGKKAPADLKASVEQVQAQISDVVPDSARAARIRDAYQQLGQLLARSARQRAALSDRFRDLYRRYDTPRETLAVIVSQQQAAARQFRAEAMEVRDQVRALTDEKEWKELATGRKRLANLYVGGNQ